MGDKGPGKAEDAGVAGERPRGELGQLPVEAGRKIRADLANLLLHDMIVVDQPFGRGRHRASVFNGLNEGLIGLAQAAPVVRQPSGQRVTGGRARENRLGQSQTLSVLFQSLDAEELLANGLLIVP